MRQNNPSTFRHTSCRSLCWKSRAAVTRSEKRHRRRRPRGKTVMGGSVEQISASKCFECQVLRFQHTSPALGGTLAKFHLILPPKAESQSVPCLIWLSGLSCTDENFVFKAAPYKAAAEHGVAILVPDVSPRGIDDEFGSSAGFYVDATVPEYKTNYNMYTYCTEELPNLIKSEFADSVDLSRCSIFGHSMGGHGALVIALKNPSKFRSVSAFAPILNPVNCPWGVKYFSGFLGSDHEAWKAYDATELIRSAGKLVFAAPILVDQGDKDGFLEQGQLLPSNFEHACAEAGQPLLLNYRPGYDHGYFFISTFIADHIAHHANILNSA
ncbi:S-formylglutathione hydrolase [Porphyridium purpureum]|uniref:S-formylglutathione hydrolase n=1 Tax=Porphyridium purpureum TaxID=35688 RepID=A0A5J4YY70_PORPP|nr:S-formylglutathione hydrolase [Porphyridium purpureum]|eukprot:POR3813..scf208_2